MAGSVSWDTTVIPFTEQMYIEQENNENLEAAGFYATGKNTEYEVYVVKDYDGRESLSKRQKVASGKFDNAGFYTVTFE